MSEMTRAQCQERGNIRNAYLVADVVEIKAEIKWRKERGEGHGWAIHCLQEMLAACEEHGVDNHGLVPAFPERP